MCIDITAITLDGSIPQCAATLLTQIGLGIDLVGAFVLFIPESTLLNSHLRFGKLKQGYELLNDGEIEQDDPGFDDISQVISSLDVVHSFHPTQDETTECVLITENTFDGPADVPTDPHVGLVQNQQYVVAWPEVDSDWDERRYYRLTAVHGEIRKRIDTAERKYRLLGISSIFLGFLLQLIAISV